MTTEPIDFKSDFKRPLPDGWRWVRLGEVCQINPVRRSTLNRSDETSTSFIPMAAVDEIKGEIIRQETRQYVEVKKGYTYFEEGDVLFAKITPCMQNGKHVVAKGLIGGIGFGSTEFHVIRPNDEIISEWIHNFIRQSWVLASAMAHFTGAVGQQRVPEYFLGNLLIPLPPLSEQKRIAAILNVQMEVVEKARKATQAQLEAAKTLPAAYLRQIFPQLGEELPDGWRWVRLGEIADFINGRAFKPDEWSNTGLPIIRIQNLTSIGAPFNYFAGVVDQCHLVQDGDLLISWSATLDVFLWLRGPAVLNQHIFKVAEQAQLVRRDYLYFAVREDMEEIRAQVHGATMRHITKPEFESIKIPLPPLSEQKRIAAILNEQMEAVGKVRTALEAQLKTINTLPASLLRRAFSGEL
jgi:type I restriction enzyme S subunit